MATSAFFQAFVAKNASEEREEKRAGHRYDQEGPATAVAVLVLHGATPC